MPGKGIGKESLSNPELDKSHQPCIYTMTRTRPNTYHTPHVALISLHCYIHDNDHCTVKAESIGTMKRKKKSISLSGLDWRKRKPLSVAIIQHSLHSFSEDEKKTIGLHCMFQQHQSICIHSAPSTPKVSHFSYVCISLIQTLKPFPLNERLHASC